MPKYDIIIIGSGLGGLLCGYVLSKEGYNVCIIEKNKQIGGCLQTFVRDGCIFNTGMHYIGSMDEGQILHRFFKYFNLTDNLKLKKLNENAFNIIEFLSDAQQYKYAMGYENFITALTQSFPDEKQALIKYCNKLKQICSSSDLYNLTEHSSYNVLQTDYLQQSAFDFIKSCTSDVKLQNVLAGTNSLYAGAPNKTPLYIHSLINNFFIQSAYRFIDGSSQIARLLSQSITNNNGTILKNSEVNKFVTNTQDNKIKFVELSNLQRIEAKYFISNVHPVKTLEMLNTRLLKKAYRNRINSLENTISTFTLYIVLKKNTFKYFNHNFYYYKDKDVWRGSYYSEKTWPQGYMLYTQATSKSDIYADSIIVMTYMKYDDVKKWENTYIEKRGNQYLDYKKIKAEKLLDFVEKKFPDLRKNIKSYYTSTPLTFRDYTATKNGSAYGVLKDCNNPLKSLILPKTKVPNLFLTGQNINMHGILGVTISSILTCAEFLGMNYLIRKINKENC